MEFLNPSLLWLTSLVSVPIIIYLINRHRYQRRKWAAMEFLLRAMRKSRRRLQIQNLLLLLIRVAIVLLLVLAAARPIARRAPLAVAPGGPENWILAIDESYSMGFRAGARSYFDEAREALAELAGGLLEPGDRVALAVVGARPRVLVRKTTVGADTKRRLRDEIEELTLSHEGMRLAASLEVLEELAADFVTEAGEPEPCRLVLFSDLQRKDWLEGDQPRSPRIREVLTRLRDRGVELSVGKLSPAESGAGGRLNVAVTDLSVEPKLVARDVPFEVRVTLRNFSDRDAENLDLSVWIDPPPEEGEGPGEAQLGEVIRVPAGSVVTRSLSFAFDRAGHHAVVAEVRSDGLVEDNRRYLALYAHEEINVLLVDGEPAVDPLDRETIFLELALEPSDDDLGAAGRRFTPFRTRYVGVDQAADLAWKDYAVVVLANVAELPPAALEKLERYVADGGALMVFLGPNVRPEYYNAWFYRGGEGLLPWPLGDVYGSDNVPVYLRFADANHPVARYFAEHKEQSYLYGGVVAFYKYFRVEAPEGKDKASERPVRVLCRYTDLDASPAILDAPFGRGRAFWVTSTADQAWNEFPVWHDYVVFIHKSVEYLLGYRERSNNLAVREPFEKSYEYPYDVALYLPPDPNDPLGTARMLVQPTRADGERYRFLYEETTWPGLYRLELRKPRSEETERVEYFAVNVDVEESDLTAMTEEEFETHFEIQPSFFDASARSRNLARQKELLRGVEFWPWLLGAALGLLLLETALAQLFGRGAR